LFINDIETIAIEFGFNNSRDYLNGFYYMSEFIFRNGDKIAIVLLVITSVCPEIDGVDIEEREDVIAFGRLLPLRLYAALYYKRYIP